MFFEIKIAGHCADPRGRSVAGPAIECTGHDTYYTVMKKIRWDRPGFLGSCDNCDNSKSLKKLSKFYFFAFLLLRQINPFMNVWGHNTATVATVTSH